MEYLLYAHVYDISSTSEPEIHKIEDISENIYRSSNILVDVTESPRQNSYDHTKYLQSVPIIEPTSMPDEVESIFDSYDESVYM